MRSKGHALRRAVLELLALLEPKLGPDHPDCLLLKVTRKPPSADDDDVDETAPASQGDGGTVTAPAMNA